MTDQGRPRPARMSAYATASSHLALLSDLALERVVDQAPQARPGIGGTSATVEAGGVRVFVKQVPVTERELRPGNVKSTANLFGFAGLLPVRPGIGGVRGLARAGRPYHDHQLGPQRRAPGLPAALPLARASRPGCDRGCLRGVRRPGRGGRALGGLGCRARSPAAPAEHRAT